MLRRSKLGSEDRVSWHEAFGLHQELLRFYLSYLLECDCAEEVLRQIEVDIGNAAVPDAFKLCFMLRSMARNAVQHIRECSQMTRGSDVPLDDSVKSAPPAQERIVYFLRDILEYSTRNTSLLIGISDGQVEKVLSFARKRIDMIEGPSSLEIQTPNGMYFRWKFQDLDPR